MCTAFCISVFIYLFMGIQITSKLILFKILLKKINMRNVYTCDYVLCTILRHPRLDEYLYSTRRCLLDKDLYLQKRGDLLKQVT